MNASLIILLAIMGISLLFLFGPLLHIRRTATITGFSWKRKVFLEHYVWVDETSYTGFPEDSRNQQSTIERYQSYQQISTQTNTTTVNGVTTTTTTPVYGFVWRTRTKYTYEIQRWVESRVLVASEDNHSAYWPPYTLDASTLERKKKREEAYVVYFQATNKKEYQRQLPEAEWSALDEHASYMLKINISGQVTDFTATAQQIAKSS